MNRRREIAFVLILWGCFLARGFFYASIFPIWEGYDEWGHLAYTQSLLAHGTLPMGSTTRVSREIEASLQLLPLPWEMRGFAASHATHDDYWRLPAEEQDKRSRELKSIPKSWAREPAQAKILLYEAQQPPLYYWLLQGPLHLLRNTSLPERVYLLRYLSLLTASIVIPIGYLVARRAFREPGIAFGVITVITAMPECVMNFSRVANDSLATALFSILLLLAIRMFEDPGRTEWSIAYGLTLGLGLLTKAYFLTAIPATALLFLWLVRSRPLQRRRILVQGCLVAGTAILLSGWWYMRSRMLTGSWSGLQQDVDLKDMSLPALFHQISQVDWSVAFDAFFISHIYFGNWSFLQLRWWMYHLFLYMTLIAAAGFLIFVWRFFRKTRAEGVGAIEGASVLIPVCFYLTFALGLAYDVLIIYSTGGGSSTGGWYIYCLVIAELLMITAGIMAVLPTGLHPCILPFLAGCFALLDLYATHFVLIPYYTGLIAHKANLALATFRIGQYSREGIGLAVVRLLHNKPAFWNEPALLASWLVYLAATIGAVALSIRLRRAGENQ